jgi:peptide/nickel transport system substrate-binding protein
LPQLDGRAGLSIVTAPGSAFTYLGFNLRRGPLADARVRLALCELVDVEPLVHYKFHGLARPATGMLAQSHWAYAPTPRCRPNRADAARLLDDAGFPAPSGGGARLRLTYKTTTDRFRKAVALVLAEQLREGGVEVDVRPTEFGTLLGDVRAGNFEMVTLKWSATFEPDLMREVFSSTEIPTPANQFGGLNRGGYANLQLDRVLRRAAEAPEDERRALYARAQTVLAQDLPYLPLWHEDTVAVVSSHLKGYRPSGQGFLGGLASAEEVP